MTNRAVRQTQPGTSGSFVAGEVTVDLSRVEFIGAAGLGLFVQVRAMVESAGGTLAVRATPAIVRQVFEAGAVSLPMDDDATDPVIEALVPVFEGSVIAEIIRTTLNAVVGAAASLPGVAASSVTLLRDGDPTTAAASAAWSRRLDEVQYTSGDGPCLTAAKTGDAVEVASISSERRWPAFIAAAAAEGVLAVLSTPVDESGGVGALNLYLRSSPVGDRGPPAAIAASIGETLALAGLAVPGFPERRLRAALDGRETIAQAQGIVTARHEVTENEAYLILARRARQRGTTLSDAAATEVRAAMGAPTDRDADDG